MQKVTVGFHLNWAFHSRFTDAEQLEEESAGSSGLVGYRQGSGG